jgi:hypothetical protein
MYVSRLMQLAKHFTDLLLHLFTAPLVYCFTCLLLHGSLAIASELTFQFFFFSDRRHLATLATSDLGNERHGSS